MIKLYKFYLYTTLYVVCVLSSAALVAQNPTATVIGTIRSDANNAETLVGASIVSLQASTGTITDINGNYTLNLTAGKHTLQFSFIGYATKEMKITLGNNETKTINITLETQNTALDEVVITGSQYEKRIAEETVSIDVIKGNLIENTNPIDLTDAVQKVPGINIVDGQATIRGGSGYAYGAGSRVQVLLDDMPLVTGDFGEVRWDFIPMENAEQIEVIKGAASVVYGSSALNGVINVRTGYAKQEPETHLDIFQGVYFNPSNRNIKWWTAREQPNFSGLNFSTRQRKGNLDIVVGANAKILENYLREGDQRHGRISLKTRYRSPKIKGLSFGINANSMFQKFGRVFIWENADTAAYQSFNGSNNDRFYLVNVDPYVNYIGKHGFTHRLRARFYRYARLRGSLEATTVANTYYSEYQLQKRFNFNLILTGGVVGNFVRAWSIAYDNERQSLPVIGVGSYLQAEQKLGNLSLVVGARYEGNSISAVLDSLQNENVNLDSVRGNSPLVFRAGLNYNLRNNTFIRASFGQGYRYPSLLELFIDDNLEDILNILPNTNLRPEKGWNAEVGIKQRLKLGTWNSYIDGVLFWSEYRNMIEFNFGLIDNRLGFQSQNTGTARIAGWEFSTGGNGKIGDVNVSYYGGYTFNYPVCLECDTTQRNIKTYLSNMMESVTSIDSLSESLLKYRFRHNMRFDLEANYKRFTLGANVAYNSFMDRVDEYLLIVLPDVEAYRAENNRGAWVVDARFIYKCNDKSSVALIAKNLSNREYTVRPGLMAAPASLTVQYRLNL